MTNKVSADIGKKKPAPKRKPAPKKKPVAKKPVAKPVPKKAAPKRKPRFPKKRASGTSGRFLDSTTAKQLSRGGEVLSQGLLGTIPASGLAGIGIWVLLILRFTIFYGAFETPDI